MEAPHTTLPQQRTGRRGLMHPPISRTSPETPSPSPTLPLPPSPLPATTHPPVHSPSLNQPSAYPGATNDIDISKLTLTGEGGNTYTLTSDDVELTYQLSSQSPSCGRSNNWPHSWITEAPNRVEAPHTTLPQQRTGRRG